MRNLILNRLQQIETEENIKILYACESGSRAWGFPSRDSDYDIRFIYVHPIDWYLSIFPKSDVIEFPLQDSLDFSGWDLKKALQLFAKSNPPLYEWLGSSTIYLENNQVIQEMRRLSSIFYSKTASLYHYLHMARRNFRQYLQGEQVWVKKYLYVLRPLLAILWLERNLGIAPTDFNILVEKLVTDPTLKDAVNKLLSSKKSGAELDSGPRINVISQFLEQELNRLEHKVIPPEKHGLQFDKLDRLFQSAVLKSPHGSGF
ncbi:MAG: nucleotidyltransferase [Microgenomates group bacterium Gr01-1014_16]|nr:MAG: nucleotidyltransferase [Microgenomates group bacterium Gr01-1014_16]